MVMDSGATTHMVNSTTGMFDVKYVHGERQKILIGNEHYMYATLEGSLNVQMGSFSCTLNNVLYVPDFFINLLGIPTILAKHHSIVFNPTSAQIVLSDGNIVHLNKKPGFSHNLHVFVLKLRFIVLSLYS